MQRLKSNSNFAQLVVLPEKILIESRCLVKYSVARGPRVGDVRTSFSYQKLALLDHRTAVLQNSNRVRVF